MFTHFFRVFDVGPVTFDRNRIFTFGLRILENESSKLNPKLQGTIEVSKNVLFN